MMKTIDSDAEENDEGGSDVLPLLIEKTTRDLKRSLESIVVNTEILMGQSTNIIEKRLLEMIMDSARDMDSSIIDFCTIGISIKHESRCLD